MSYNYLLPLHIVYMKLKLLHCGTLNFNYKNSKDYFHLYNYLLLLNLPHPSPWGFSSKISSTIIRSEHEELDAGGCFVLGTWVNPLK